MILLIDVIILSYAKTESLRQVTNECITSLLLSEDPSIISFDILIIESNKDLRPYQYPMARTLYPEESFGYNKYLNIGIQYTHNPYICFCNNDLMFHKNWATKIMEVFNANSAIMSCSPIDPWLHNQYDYDKTAKHIIGYEKMKHVTGWCFMVRRSIFDIIGPFDEQFSFWYCDDDYINALKKHHIMHALVTESRVDHLSGKTILSNAVSDRSRRNNRARQWLRFDRKWHRHSSIINFLKFIKYHLFVR